MIHIVKHLMNFSEQKMLMQTRTFKALKNAKRPFDFLILNKQTS